MERHKQAPVWTVRELLALAYTLREMVEANPAEANREIRGVIPSLPIGHYDFQEASNLHFECLEMHIANGALYIIGRASEFPVNFDGTEMSPKLWG